MFLDNHCLWHVNRVWLHRLNCIVITFLASGLYSDTVCLRINVLQRNQPVTVQSSKDDPGLIIFVQISVEGSMYFSTISRAQFRAARMIPVWSFLSRSVSGCAPILITGYNAFNLSFFPTFICRVSKSNRSLNPEFFFGVTH